MCGVGVKICYAFVFHLNNIVLHVPFLSSEFYFSLYLSYLFVCLFVCVFLFIGVGHVCNHLSRNKHVKAHKGNICWRIELLSFSPSLFPTVERITYSRQRVSSNVM